MHNYKHLKCSEHYVNEEFLNRFRRRVIKSDYLSNRLFRLAVVHQQAVLKRWLREELGTDQFSLDHHPVPFSALKHIFLKQQGIDPRNHSPHPPTVQLLRDWQHFHGALAEYRVTSTHYNYSLNQWYSDYWHNLDGRWKITVPGHGAERL